MISLYYFERKKQVRSAPLAGVLWISACAQGVALVRRRIAWIAIVPYAVLDDV